MPGRVGEDQKVASKVSMSTKVSSPGWLSEKQPSSSWTTPATSGGGLCAGARHSPQ